MNSTGQGASFQDIQDKFKIVTEHLQERSVFARNKNNNKKIPFILL